MQAFEIISSSVRTALTIAAIATTGALLGGVNALANYSQHTAQAQHTAIVAKSPVSTLSSEQPVQRVTIIGKRAA